MANEDVGSPSDRLSPEMREVLDELKHLGARPLAQLTVEEARAQPGPADAAASLELKRGIDRSAELAIESRDLSFPSAGRPVGVRIYKPAEGQAPHLVVLYFHSGGFVIGSLDTYDLTARRLALQSGAIVISVNYRRGPEHPFPSAHDDAWAAYVSMLDQIQDIGGDSARITVMGESAGGNLAANVAIRAVAEKVTPPACQILLYPLAGDDTNSLSYRENADSVPLGKAGMQWFLRHAFADPDAAHDPRINLAARHDLAGLPPTLVITADLDPLRSEGQEFAKQLRAAGVTVNSLNLEHLGHEFFGMSKLVPGAGLAMQSVLAAIRHSF